MNLTGKSQKQVDAEKAQAHRQSEIAEMTAYLASTDWYAIRLAETGKDIPDEVRKCRQTARDRISELRTKGGST